MYNQVFVDIVFVLGLLAIRNTGLVLYFRSERVLAISAKRLQRITMNIMSNRSYGSTDETSPPLPSAYLILWSKTHENKI